jgi:pimeloyl-ACP methyl ester carboxylesterase
MPTIQLDCHTIHYSVEGLGPDVLMIHGLASSHRMWERPLKRLALSGFRAWALDLPGGGESDSCGMASSWYTIANMTSAVETFIERVGIQNVSLVGHSMGGSIVLELARQRPELLGALVLVAPAVSGRVGLLHTLLDSPLRRLLFSLSQRHPTLVLWGERTMLGASEFIHNPGLRRDVQDLAHTTPEAFMGGLKAVLDFDFTDRLRMISTPTLVVVGTRDMTLPPSESELAARQISGARLVKMRGVGHQPVDERPEEFDHLLVEFLKDNLVKQ